MWRVDHLILCGIALASLLCCQLAQAVDEGDRAVDFSLLSASGESVKLSDYSGKVVYLDFWASWCSSCRESLPWINQLREEYKAKGFEVVTVNVDRDRQQAEKLLKKIEAPAIVAYDPEGKTPALYKLRSMPSSFLIGKDGTIHSVYQGFKSEKRDELKGNIEKLLNSK